MDIPVSPGDVLLGKYRVERVLGKGGMGVVVAARHLELGELFAIKLLLPALLGQREVLERFLREARAAARLKSEHVARVHDVGRLENGVPYMLMEYLEGSDIKALIAEQGPLSFEDAIAYTLQVCDAIGEAHGHKIIHRDLKPANLFLIRRPNGTPCVKVLDFGISKHTGPEEVDLTGTHATIGSPLYMAPEQIAKTKSVDVRCDIWSMGVVLYELVTGRSPFKAASMLEVVSRVLQEEPLPPSRLRRDLSEGLESVILRCLRKAPGERYQTIDELAEALRQLPAPKEETASRAPTAKPVGTGTLLLKPEPRVEEEPAAKEEPRKMRMRTLRLPSAPEIAPEAGAAADPGTTAGSATASAWGQTAHSTQRKRTKAMVIAGVGLVLAVAGGVVLFRPKLQPVPGDAVEPAAAGSGAPESAASEPSPIPAEAPMQTSTISPPEELPAMPEASSAPHDEPPQAAPTQVATTLPPPESTATRASTVAPTKVGKTSAKPAATPAASAPPPAEKPTKFDPDGI